MKKETNKNLIENFTILLYSLYEHNSIQENKVIIDEFSKELRSLQGKGNALVELHITCDNGKEEINKYFLEEAAKNGLEMPEDVENFYLIVNALKVKQEGNARMVNKKQIFKSSTFVVKENCKKKEVEKDSILIKDKEVYQEKTGNRIRFGKQNVLEL